jgi:3-phenylpropionate/cinnamic acid dioxygenase small subunit
MTKLDKIASFLFEEAHLLDDNQFDRWLDLFREDCWYWVPSQIDQQNPFDTVSIIYDDRKLLETRMRRLCGGAMHTPLPRTNRLIGNICLVRKEHNIDIVRSKFSMAEYCDDRRRNFAGTLYHGLATIESGFEIAWKKIELVDCEAEMEGITVPF